MRWAGRTLALVGPRRVSGNVIVDERSTVGADDISQRFENVPFQESPYDFVIVLFHHVV